MPLFRAELYLELCSLWALVLEDFGEHLNEPSPLFRCLLLSSLCHFHLLVPHEGQPLRAVSMAVCRSLLHHSIFHPPSLPTPRQYPSCICQRQSLWAAAAESGQEFRGGKKKQQRWNQSFYVIFCIKMCIVKNMFIALKAVPKVLLKSNRFTAQFWSMIVLNPSCT